VNSTATRPQITSFGRQKLYDERSRLVERLQDSEGRLQQEMQHRDDLHWYDTQQEISQMRRRLDELELVLAEPVAVMEPADGVVTLGKWVTVREETGSEHTFVIVAPIENDASKGYISFESPVGGALMGRQIGETVSVLVPKGERRFSILSIQ
jgi:transcription elongation factor GreA